MSKSFPIEFDYTIVELSKTIHLRALVEIHSSGTSYEVTAIRTNSQAQVLPDQKIKKSGNKWVHTDSEKETFLSIAIGNAIERQLAPSMSSST